MTAPTEPGLAAIPEGHPHAEALESLARQVTDRDAAVARADVGSIFHKMRTRQAASLRASYDALLHEPAARACIEQVDALIGAGEHARDGLDLLGIVKAIIAYRRAASPTGGPSGGE